MITSAEKVENLDQPEKHSNFMECQFDLISGVPTAGFIKAATTSLPSSPLSDKNDADAYEHLKHLDLVMGKKIQSPFKSMGIFNKAKEHIRSPPNLSNPTNKKAKRNHGKQNVEIKA